MAMNERGDRSAVQEAVALFPEGWRTAYLVILGMLLGVGLGIAALEEFLWHGKIEFVVRILAVAGHGGGVTPVSVLLAVFLTEARGGHGAAPIPARMLVKLAAAPSAFVRHGERFVTYKITLRDLRDLRDALYPPERLDGKTRKPPTVGRMWPRIRQAIRVINQDARIPILDPKTGYGHFHNLLRINENFGRIDLDMPINVVLDIPPEVEGGVQLPVRLDQWGAESAPAYRALIGLSFLWHEPGRTHAPKGDTGCVVLESTPTIRSRTTMRYP